MDKPRNPWIAALLSLLTIGLGQVYAGAPKRGVGFFILYRLLSIVFLTLLVVLAPKTGLLLFVSFIIVCPLFVLIDAARIAKSHREYYECKRYNKWYYYLLIPIIITISIDPLTVGLVRHYIIQAYTIPSGAMKDTILVGDRIITDKLIYQHSDPQRGDVIVFIYPLDPSKDFIKRVVAVGGDTVQLMDKKLLINGQLVDEPFVRYSDPKIRSGETSPRDNLGPLQVPEDQYFVMGDNRDESYDSRFWRFVPRSEVKGKARSIYFSWDKDNASVRWERIGMEIK